MHEFSSSEFDSNEFGTTKTESKVLIASNKTQKKYRKKNVNNGVSSVDSAAQSFKSQATSINTTSQLSLFMSKPMIDETLLKKRDLKKSSKIGIGRQWNLRRVRLYPSHIEYGNETKKNDHFVAKASYMIDDIHEIVDQNDTDFVINFSTSISTVDDLEPITLSFRCTDKKQKKKWIQKLKLRLNIAVSQNDKIWSWKKSSLKSTSENEESSLCATKQRLQLTLNSMKLFQQPQTSTKTSRFKITSCEKSYFLIWHVKCEIIYIILTKI